MHSEAVTLLLSYLELPSTQTLDQLLFYAKDELPLRKQFKLLALPVAGECPERERDSEIE